MNVASAKTHINQIDKICKQTEQFCKEHEELSDETGFLSDVVGYLCDYRKVLEQAINRAELDL